MSDDEDLPTSAGVRDALAVGGTTVAVVVDGAGASVGSVPRPYLHPVRTRGGTTISAHHPPDHEWHCGVGVAVPDLDGVNCWGGPTYVHGTGYVWRDDHGRAEVRRRERRDGVLEQDVRWTGPDGRVLLHEHRSVAAYATDAGWELRWSSSFCTPGDAGVVLGSPGSNGRVGAGYGGFTWRFPPCTEVVVRTADASGEAAVHGSFAPWVEWSAAFADGRATVRLEALDHRDPWFVRVAEYPAIGSALAWSDPVTVHPGTPLVRSFRATVTDGTAVG